jgi:transcriptional regulator with XRE-family HTH domain
VDKRLEKELKVAFGRQVRKLRLAKGFSMRGFAKEADMDYSQLARIETGLISPIISTVYRIATALNVGFTEIFDFSHPNPANKQ